MGYNLEVKVMSAEDYGVAERRRRTIFIGSRINAEIIFPERMYLKPVKVGDVIKNLKSKEWENIQSRYWVCPAKI